MHAAQVLMEHTNMPEQPPASRSPDVELCLAMAGTRVSEAAWNPVKRVREAAGDKKGFFLFEPQSS